MNHEHWSTIVANIVTSLGILGFIGIYLAHRQSENQFKFTVMLSCIDRFQQLSPLLHLSVIRRSLSVQVRMVDSALIMLLVIFRLSLPE